MPGDRAGNDSAESEPARQEGGEPQTDGSEADTQNLVEAMATMRRC